MSNEKLQTWALVAEILGGVAVFLSLIFVGLEIRQSSEETALNTRAIEVSAYQDLISQIILLNNEFVGDPELSELWASTNSCEPIESRADRAQLFKYSMSVIRHGDMAYHQYEQGLISEERLDNSLVILVSEVSRNYFVRDEWERGKSARYKPFAEHVDRLMVASGGTEYPCPNLMTDR